MYTWVPFYQELTAKLLSYTGLELLDLLKQLDIEGLTEKDHSGQIIDLTDMDPYSFLSYLNKYGDQRRIVLLRKLKQLLALKATAPLDVNGLPNAAAQNVRLFGDSKVRKERDIDKLRLLYEQVEQDAVAPELFKEVLQIYKTAPAKLSEALFYHKPDRYLPINGQTRSWLDKRGLRSSFKTLEDYHSILESVKALDARPFYEISEAAYVENVASQEKAIRYFCVGAKFNSTKEDQLARFIAEGIWVNGHGETKPKEFDLIKSIPVGAKLASKVTYTQGPGHSVSVLGVRGVGTVKSNPGDGWSLKVEWEKDFKPFELLGKGSYQSTIQEVTSLEDIQLIFHHSAMSQSPVLPTYPKNIILYGPPGTGKTYETIDLAVKIIEGSEGSSHVEHKQRFDALQEAGLIEFITFHQNYSYEDFVMGLKPDVDGEDLRFQRNYGIFYQIAKRARLNYESSQIQIPSRTVFEEVFQRFMQPFTEQGEEIRVQMTSGIPFYITDISERSISFRKNRGDSQHTLSIATLKALYEGNQDLKTNGLKPYYQPLLDVLISSGSHQTHTEPLKNFVLVIDEINRANISRVFGELITLLEEDKRLGQANALSVTLPSGERFALPPNLYVIGTMNTADKSLALLDIALRRRFEFMGKYPDYELAGMEGRVANILKKLNDSIYHRKSTADYLIGHAYFLHKPYEALGEVFNQRVIPLLMEYFNGKTTIVREILTEAGLSAELDTRTYQLKVKDLG